MTTLGTRRLRRTAAVAAITGLAATMVVAVPALLPSGSPGSPTAASAQALRHLAHVAAGGPVLHIGAGEYIHLVFTGHQKSTPGQPSVDSRYEFWTDASGKTWQRRDEDSSGSVPDTHEVWVTKPGGTVGQIRTQHDLEQLPVDPTALRAYLVKHGEPANSPDEQIFLAVGTTLRGGMAPPALRSAAIEILAGLRHVRIGSTTRDANGNAVQEFVFEDEATRPNERWALLFDTNTAQISEERYYIHGNERLGPRRRHGTRYRQGNTCGHSGPGQATELIGAAPGPGHALGIDIARPRTTSPDLPLTDRRPRARPDQAQAGSRTHDSRAVLALDEDRLANRRRELPVPRMGTHAGLGSAGLIDVKGFPESGNPFTTTMAHSPNLAGKSRSGPVGGTATPRATRLHSSKLVSVRGR